MKFNGNASWESQSIKMQFHDDKVLYNNKIDLISFSVTREYFESFHDESSLKYITDTVNIQSE